MTIVGTFLPVLFLTMMILCPFFSLLIPFFPLLILMMMIISPFLLSSFPSCCHSNSCSSFSAQDNSSTIGLAVIISTYLSIACFLRSSLLMNNCSHPRKTRFDPRDLTFRFHLILRRCLINGSCIPSSSLSMSIAASIFSSICFIMSFA